jgi:predicted dehydrogenase
MADKIRIGMIGAGPWSSRSHLPALALLPEYELKAIATTRQETADAAAAKFGAPLAFGDFREMVRHPEVDLVAVCVRVPFHHELTMPALAAGKQVYCEWPLGANLGEAEEMAALARRQGVRTIIGLQGRLDPGANFIRDMVASGEIGEVLTANVSLFRGGALARPASRTWQREKSKGATTLTIMGGHTIDTFCHCVGAFSELSARLDIRVPQWRVIETGEMVDVDGPDNVLIHGRLQSGATAAVHVTAVPHEGIGGRMEIFGREGTIIATFPEGPNIGPTRVLLSKGGGELTELSAPDRFVQVPEGTPRDSIYNVCQVYSRFAAEAGAAERQVPDFEDALQLHRLLDAIERSSDEGRSVRLA